MPSQQIHRRFAFLVLILCFGFGLITLRLHLASGDGPLLVLATLAGLITLGLGIGTVVNNRVQLMSERA